MGNVIRLVRVTKIETRYTKEGEPFFLEKHTMQRAEDMGNYEIYYDGDEKRRLVEK